jgi:dolichyl-phosphate-mannose--protein O-mannosyl transferase
MVYTDTWKRKVSEVSREYSGLTVERHIHSFLAFFCQRLRVMMDRYVALYYSEIVFFFLAFTTNLFPLVLLFYVVKRYASWRVAGIPCVLFATKWDSITGASRILSHPLSSDNQEDKDEERNG